MQAIIYLDIFLRKNRKVEYVTLKLVAISCVIIAVKMNEDMLLSMSKGAQECDFLYDPEMI